MYRVLAVHGFSMSSAVWKKVMPLFPARYRVFAIDLKGFGRVGPASGYGCPDFAEDIAQFMAALDLQHAALEMQAF